MSFLNSIFSVGNLLKFSDGLEGTGYEFLGPILDFIETAMIPIIIVLLAVGAIYAIILGVNMARAESGEKRDEAKKRIMNFLIGIAVVVVLLVIIYVLAANVTTIFGLAQDANNGAN